MSGHTYTVYQAIPGLASELLVELESHALSKVEKLSEDLYLSSDGPKRLIWTQNIWPHSSIIKISSIGDAVKKLKAIQKYWSHYPLNDFRRSQLIQQQLPKIEKFKDVNFLHQKPDSPIGIWSLIDRETLIYCSSPVHPYPNGEIHFKQDHTNPPSRAYLKLWEFFTLHVEAPKANERCLDMGSAPGGWTWVLLNLGCQVTSVDKASMDTSLDTYPNYNHLKQSAFALDPKTVGEIDWFFSDIICYPEKLFNLVKKWIDSKNVKNFVCTIKFQGETDFKILEEFKSIPGSQIFHLYHNKHELTWYLRLQ